MDSCPDTDIDPKFLSTGILFKGATYTERG